MMKSIIVAATLTAAALVAAPTVHATIGAAWVCMLLDQGATVPQIAQQLAGDPRVSRLQIEDALWAVVAQDCGPIVLR